MTSFVISAKEKAKRTQYAEEFCQKEKIDRFDITLIEKDQTAKPATQSIGIEEIKRVQKKIFLKPIKSAQKAVIIEDAHLLTTEAQNALLKVLEEPPAQTIIILGVNTKEALLPTILSRCTIIELESEKAQISEKEREEFNQFIEHVFTMSMNERLKKAELLAKDKEKTLEWLEKLQIVMRDAILAEPSDHMLRLALREFMSVHTTLKTTNINPRFALEHTLLNCSLV